MLLFKNTTLWHVIIARIQPFNLLPFRARGAEMFYFRPHIEVRDQLARPGRTQVNHGIYF